MYYLYYEDDDETILLKSSNINDLDEIAKGRQLTGYSISDKPINYEEEHYVSVAFTTRQNKGGASGKNLSVRTKTQEKG